jgi:hypothetical protein
MTNGHNRKPRHAGGRCRGRRIGAADSMPMPDDPLDDLWPAG